MTVVHTLPRRPFATTSVNESHEPARLTCVAAAAITKYTTASVVSSDSPTHVVVCTAPTAYLKSSTCQRRTGRSKRKNMLRLSNSAPMEPTAKKASRKSPAVIKKPDWKTSANCSTCVATESDSA